MSDFRSEYLHAVDIARAKRRSDLALAAAVVLFACLCVAGVISLGGLR